MDEPLTPDEDVVFREFLRLDVEPNQIPVELHAGFMKRLAGSCNMSLARVRRAVQGLIDKGKFDTSDEAEEERQHNEREIIRDLILHDPEIQDMIRNMVAELCEKRKEADRGSMHATTGGRKRTDP